MNIILSKKQIGQKVTELLKMKGLSQEDWLKVLKSPAYHWLKLNSETEASIS